MRYGAAVFPVSVVLGIAVASSQKNFSTDAANSGVVLVLPPCPPFLQVTDFTRICISWCLR